MVIEVKDLYPTEKQMVRSIISRAQAHFAKETNFDEHTRLKFHNMVKDLLANEMNLLLDGVKWELDVSDDPNDKNIYHVPTVVIAGRIDNDTEKTMDHDRMTHEIRNGQLDGKVGSIREDGSFREDFKKKDYY